MLFRSVLVSHGEEFQINVLFIRFEEQNVLFLLD